MDPVLDGGDPQSLNGYGYANGNPITFSDPSGLSLKSDNLKACNGNPSCIAAVEQGTPAEPGSSSGKKTPKKTRHKMDRTSRHNDAVKAAESRLKRTVLLGRKGHWVRNLHIPGASQTGKGAYGIPDLLWYDDATGNYYVWEVKVQTVGAAEARRVALNYAKTYNVAHRGNGRGGSRMFLGRDMQAFRTPVEILNKT